MKTVDIKDYLTKAEEHHVDPNFFLNEPYLRFMEATCNSKDGWIWLEKDEWTLFPPLGDDPVPSEIYNMRILTDFVTHQPNLIYREFFDWEYIYDPKRFQSHAMIGHRWETFRKNIRKWPKANPAWEYTLNIPNQANLNTLLGEWLEMKSDNVHDVGLVLHFVLEDVEGVSRKFMYSEGKIVGVNVWTENYQYINFVYCIIKPEGHPFLDEFMRYSFYTDPDILDKNKMVNDGGSLGNEGLERYKDKLNPVRKRRVYSWFN